MQYGQVKGQLNAICDLGFSFAVKGIVEIIAKI